MTAAPAAPTRRLAPAVARAAVFGAAVAVVWWLGAAVAGADPAGTAADSTVPPPDPAVDLDPLIDLLPENSIVIIPTTPQPAPVVEAPEAEAPEVEGAEAASPARPSELVGLLDATVTPLLAPAPPAAPALAAMPAGTRSPTVSSTSTAAAAPLYAAVAPVVEPLTRSVLAPVAPQLVDPVVRRLVAPTRPMVTALAAPFAAIAGAASEAAPAAGEGFVPATDEPAPGSLAPDGQAVAPALVPVAPAMPPPPAPAPLPAGPSPAARSARLAAELGTADHALAPVASATVDAPAAPAAPTVPDDRPGPRPVSRRLPWATGPSGAGGPAAGSRDLPDRAHGAVADAIASARVATPAERAPVTPAGVGGSVSAASRPSVTPD